MQNMVRSWDQQSPMWWLHTFQRRKPLCFLKQIYIYIYGSGSKPIVPLVNIKIAGKWMSIPLKMVLIGIDPYPYIYLLQNFCPKGSSNIFRQPRFAKIHFVPHFLFHHRHCTAAGSGEPIHNLNAKEMAIRPPNKHQQLKFQMETATLKSTLFREYGALNPGNSPWVFRLQWIRIVVFVSYYIAMIFWCCSQKVPSGNLT